MLAKEELATEGEGVAGGWNSMCKGLEACWRNLSHRLLVRLEGESAVGVAEGETRQVSRGQDARGIQTPSEELAFYPGPVGNPVGDQS